MAAREDELASERIRYDALAHRAVVAASRLCPIPGPASRSPGETNLISHLLDDRPPLDPAAPRAPPAELDDRRILLQLLQRNRGG